jgi:hypothetical protein
MSNSSTPKRYLVDTKIEVDEPRSATVEYVDDWEAACAAAYNNAYSQQTTAYVKDLKTGKILGGYRFASHNGDCVSQGRCKMPRQEVGEIQFDPELEGMYQSFKTLESARRGGDTNLSYAIALLGDEIYAKRFRMPGVTGPVTPLVNPKVAIRYDLTPTISTSRHANSLRADHFITLHDKIDSDLAQLADLALNTYGSQGPLVSGCIRDHFPTDIKDRLRFLSQGKTHLQDAIGFHNYLAHTRSPRFQ